MDPKPPKDLDQYGERVNYGVQNGNGTAIIKWVASTAGLCAVGIIAYLFLDNASIRKEAANNQQALVETLTSMRERLAAIETKLEIGCKP